MVSGRDSTESTSTIADINMDGECCASWMITVVVVVIVVIVVVVANGCGCGNDGNGA